MASPRVDGGAEPVDDGDGRVCVCDYVCGDFDYGADAVAAYG